MLKDSCDFKVDKTGNEDIYEYKVVDSLGANAANV